MSKPHIATIDGNEAVAYVAYRVSEVCSIYPITPSSPMAEHTDEWSAKDVHNIWGNVPDVIEMQSEGGAAGAAHGALQTGALTTTFTSSQGLMLMLPNMYKIAGELTSTVFHVAARSLAAQALSIFGDHADVMAARTTGFAMISSASVQQAHDIALISHAATLQSRIPFMHFFDGFRTSHEVNKLSLLSEDDIRSMIDDELVYQHRQRALNPDNPFIRGTAQNPDVYFQGRESSNSYYDQLPRIIQQTMDKFAELTGRQYHLFEYFGAPDATRVLIVMGSAGETIEETIKILNQNNEKVGFIQVHLYRPFSIKHMIKVLPASTESIAVLDRTKEIGAGGEPLYQDVLTALVESQDQLIVFPKIIGGRYGLSSKEFTPAMVQAIYAELNKDKPKNHFTIGINDDVTHTSLEYDKNFNIESAQVTRALFFGLGSDGTVGANKNSIKIIGENTDLYAQGYFVYDSRKAGSQTTSHLRFGPAPIKAPYLIQSASFIACHAFNFINKVELLNQAEEKAIFLLNSPFNHNEIWAQLPRSVQQIIIDKKLQFYVIDATSVAKNAGMGRRINTIMQTCFFALSGVLPKDEAITQIKNAIEKTYSKKGKKIVDMNFKAVDAALDHLFQVTVSKVVDSDHDMVSMVPPQAPVFVQTVTAPMLKGHGDDLPVSAIPVDGTYPSGTTQWEKRNVSDIISIWEPELCIQCGNCSFVCPHSVIRSKFFHESLLTDAPDDYKSAVISARGFPETRYTLQVYIEDCTGCGLCYEACPVQDTENPDFRAINLANKAPVFDAEKDNIKFFETLPMNERHKVDFSSVRGVQFLEPLFEFSGACAGCGETAYIKILSQLFGPRLIVANATGCSSIYGGNLPTTPWTKNADNRGPAWSNSLFEDNAEFGLGMRITADKHIKLAIELLEEMRPQLGDELVDDIINSKQNLASETNAQRKRLVILKEKLKSCNKAKTKNLLSVIDHLVRRSIWLLGGDGWAYDIGSAGLDHALSTGRNINVLVMDTEVYSNTGGQMSKATPTAATARFATAGKSVGKKDLALQAISYGNVYVAKIAIGANPQQTLLAMREAEAYKGPSIILAYSPCIAHGYDIRYGLQQQNLAVASGYWPLMRYNPELRQAGKNPFILDSLRPKIGLREFAYNEMRYKSLTKTHPKEAEHLMNVAQELVDLRWKTYEDMSNLGANEFNPVA